MATRADYRTALRAKLLNIEDSGYGDFDYLDADLNTYLELAVAKLFPVIYDRDSLASQTVTQYGTNYLGSVSLSIDESRVYLVESSDEYEVQRGWSRRPGKLIGLDADITAVNVYYILPYAMPSSDGTAVGWPDEYKPLVVQAAFVEALESRQDIGTRPDPPQEGGRSRSMVIDSARSALERMKSDMGMALPSEVL